MSPFNYIMGIQSFANQDSGACLLRYSNDGDLVDYVAISEERLIRRKHPYTFPLHSLAYCLEHYGLEDLEAVDLIVTDFIRIKRWFNSGPGYNHTEFDYLKRKLKFDVNKIVTISHHMAHAASVFYTSGFEDAAVLIVDGNGSDLQTTSFFDADNGKIRYIDEYKAQGIGAVYNVVTNAILNLGRGGEGKTMGLAPFGAAHDPVLDFEGKLNGIKNDFSDFVRRQPYSDVLNFIDADNKKPILKGEYKVSKGKEDLLDPYFSRVAYDVQAETERVLTHLGQEIEKRTGRSRLCLAGGVALNSVANKVMFDACGFEDIFVFPACSDTGIPFGLAVWGYYNAREVNLSRRAALTFRNAYTGIEYPESRTRDMLERYSIPYTKGAARDVAQIIADGNIVAWFQGGSEYGPRALGHRSILADPRREEMRDTLNLRVKHREAFRPFAPSILLDYNSEYFDLDVASPYMLLVADVKKPKDVPAITHVDGTARVQTLTREDNGVYFDLVEAFHKITGVPVILNTSFNDNGEPIVETPEDAAICFFGTDMDFLVIGEYIIDATKVDKAAVAARMSKDRSAQIDARHQSYLERFIDGYDSDECKAFIAESNKIAEWYVRRRSQLLLEDKILDWVKRDVRVAVVGTADHTALLRRYANRFYDVNIAGLVLADHRPEQKDAPCDHNYPALDWEFLSSGDYDEILISSFEYMYEIQYRLREMDIKKPVYSIYDSSSRSLFEVLTALPPFPVD